MDDRSRRTGRQSASGFRASIELTYDRADDMRRDRLPDATRGIIARSTCRLHDGDAVNVRIEIARQRVTVSALGVVRWATPLARGSLAGLDLEGVGHRDDVKLDLLFGIRQAGSPEEATARAPTGAPPLSVAMLQPNGVLRQVLQGALARYARESGGAALRIDAVDDLPSFLASISSRQPDLAIIDCDGVEEQADPIVDHVRSSEPTRRTPVILLSSVRSPRVKDRYTATVRKPVAMKAFLKTTGLLLQS